MRPIRSGRLFADPLIVLKHLATAKVADIVEICGEGRLKIVPQGGNTSLACGSVPTGSGDEIIVNMSRINRIRDIDTFNDTISVDAGCALAAVREAAQRAGRLFPQIDARFGTGGFYGSGHRLPLRAPLDAVRQVLQSGAF